MTGWKPKLCLISVLVIAGLVLVQCSSLVPISEATPVFHVGLALGKGGLGDRSFNDAAYQGLVEARRKYNVAFAVTEYYGAQGAYDELRAWLDSGYDMIIGVGYENAPIIKQLAQEYPDRTLVVIDESVEAENVTSVVFREQEADFLMGVLAAMLTRTGNVGFIGGMDIPPVQRIEAGFRQGVAYHDETVQVVSTYVGAFDDPETARQLAMDMYQNMDIDLIYNAAGKSGLGVIEAAKLADKWTLGTTGDQRYLAPGNVIGNRQKRLDVVVMDMIEATREGTIVPGIYSYGLAENGFQLGPFDESIVTPSMLGYIYGLQDKIIKGVIVPGE